MLVRQKKFKSESKIVSLIQVSQHVQILLIERSKNWKMTNIFQSESFSDLAITGHLDTSDKLCANLDSKSHHFYTAL